MKENLACVSIDLDPVGHYLRARKWQPNADTQLNAVYDDAVPRFLQVLKELAIPATLFAVGEDLLHEQNVPLIREASEQGHEIANHSMNHRTDFFRLDEDQAVIEIAAAEKLIKEVTGKAVRGFRAPGWNISSKAFKILANRGYAYDSSVLGSALNRLNKFYMEFRSPNGFHSDLDAVHELRKAPLVPYYPDLVQFWRPGDSSILELPPTVSQTLRFPFHGSFMFFPFGMTYIKRCMRAHARTGNPLIYEFHGLDLIDPRAVRDDRLKVKDGFAWPIEKKIKRLRIILEWMKEAYSEIVTLEMLAERWRERLNT